MAKSSSKIMGGIELALAVCMGGALIEEISLARPRGAVWSAIREAAPTLIEPARNCRRVVCVMADMYRRSCRHSQVETQIIMREYAGITWKYCRIMLITSHSSDVIRGRLLS